MVFLGVFLFLLFFFLLCSGGFFSYLFFMGTRGSGGEWKCEEAVCCGDLGCMFEGWVLILVMHVIAFSWDLQVNA